MIDIISWAQNSLIIVICGNNYRQSPDVSVISKAALINCSKVDTKLLHEYA
jgi:hypothetical protein